ncbi:MAG: hypothetical protein AAGG01_07435, partial [Planctomycetota bacterium]
MLLIALTFTLPIGSLPPQDNPTWTPPSRTETVAAERIASMNRGGEVPERRLGGRPRTEGDILILDGADDGNRQ